MSLKMRNRGGFTLAEMLVVLAVLSLVGVLVVTIFTRTLRGSNKAQILSAIKQNGQSVLEIMDKSIRGADNLVCISEPDNNTIVLERGGTYQRFRFVIDFTGRTNGAVRQDTATPSAQESDPRLFINRVCGAGSIMEEPVSLSDTNTQTGVALLSGSFKKSPQAGFKDVVTIEFVLGPPIEAPKAVAGQIDPVVFQTTIQLR